MSFPGTVPVTAAANEEGVCVPVGWVPVYRYESEDVADPLVTGARVAVVAPSAVNGGLADAAAVLLG